jgi:dolichyl-phosphate beta-glucosyltransferase
MDISIVIPAFEERKKIVRDIEAAADFIRNNNLTAEIIVVDDGSTDGTGEAAKSVQPPPGITLKVQRLHHHKGKGCAIRTGIKQTRGEYVMFADSGCCVPYQNALQGLKLLKSAGCDIAHGSRKMPDSQIKKPQNFYRRICSGVFHRFVTACMKIPAELTDTQCGFKIYRGDVARNLYNQCITDGFMFDVEIIILAMKHGFRIKEFGIEWSCDTDSRLRPGRNLWGIISELLTIRRTFGKK